MRRLAALAAVVPIIAAGCAGTSSNPNVRTTPPIPAGGSTTTQAKASSLTNWPTYHRTNSRAGLADATITLPLHHSWTSKLDGAVYGEPLIVNGKALVATENDSVYELNPTNGHVVWRTHLGSPQPLSGLPCGDIDPLGITGTPAYDATTNSVFVVAETDGGHHTLWALNPANGHRRWHKSTDVLPSRNRKAEQERSALLVAHGRIITSYGGLAGDCDNYVGYLTSTSVTGRGKTTHYAVPTSREAGMWSPAGPVVGTNGNVYVASGNGAEEHGSWDKSDSVTEVNPVSMHRIAVFAPSTWKQDNVDDLDLGSSSPVPAAGRILIAGKRGTIYLLRTSLGGVGKQLAKSSDGACTAFGGAAHSGHTVVLPCHNGIRALTIGARSLHTRWTDSSIYGSPVIVGKKVLVADLQSGDLKVLSLKTGHVLASTSVGKFTHFPSEVADGHLILVPTLSGVTALRGS
jgi:outer membrane protein assembly factor BamB